MLNISQNPVCQMLWHENKNVRKELCSVANYKDCIKLKKEHGVINQNRCQRIDSFMYTPSIFIIE